MNIRHLARVSTLLLLVVVGSAHALDPTRLISQYGHSAWRVRDGDLPAPAYPITQTADGYLWIGTQAGLVRFDGIRFVPLSALTTSQLPGRFVASLVAARDGSLWIGTSGGLSRWANQQLINYPDTSHGVGPMIEDRSGGLWFAPRAPTAALSLCQVSGRDLRCYGKADGIDFPADGCCTGTLVEDPGGNFWISTAVSVIRWKPGSPSASIAVQPKVKSGITGTMVLAPQQRDSLWVGIDSRGPGLGLLQITNGVINSPVVPQLDASALAVQALFVDHHGVLWIGTLDQGVYRIHGDSVDHFRAADGLSSDSVYWFYEDREGSLWVSTAEGIDRFRDLRVATFSRREGLSVAEVDSVLASRDGKIWIGGAEALDMLDHGRIFSLKSGQGLPGHQVTSLMEDHAGQIWIGIDNTLSIYKNSEFTPITGLDGGPIGFVHTLAEDADGNVWASLPESLARIKDRRVREVVPKGAPVAAGSDPGVWLLLKGGTLERYHQGKIESFAYNLDVKRRNQLIVTSDGAVLGATDAGVIGWKNGRQRTLTRANGLPCDSVNALTTDSLGALWLYGECGLLEVPEEQLREWWARTETKVHPRVLDVFDGVRPGRAPFVGAARAPDGRLWFANGSVLQMVDPRDVAVQNASFPVHIEEIVADRKRYPAQSDLLLPPNPRDLEIDYAALSLAVPQRVRFRYRLDGHDVSWQEAGTRRQAFYTDLAPGRYRFHLVASNSDGVWDETGTTLDLRVAAAWYQTAWFRALSVVLGVVVIALFYRLRLRQIARAMSARFDERLAERTRLAREFHDTLLQTIQGSKMVADDALEESTDLAGMRRAMKRLSTWLGQAMQEGRAALDSLRSSTTQTNDLADSLRRASEDPLLQCMDVAFSATGEARDMHPIVRDEIYRIGYEAIRNACVHSKGTRLEVALSYSRDLTLIVRDDGQGMDSLTLSRGKKGHFGIQGMHERAERIGATLTIESSPGSGTQIRLVVPGRVIFREVNAQPTSPLARIRHPFGRSPPSSTPD